MAASAEGDPITPIWGAEAAVAELGNARLLKVNGEGHTSMFVEPSTCRDDAGLSYLVSLQLPQRHRLQCRPAPLGREPLTGDGPFTSALARHHYVSYAVDR
jgi:TAP-like protein